MIDDRQIPHLICVCLKHLLYDFLEVFWTFYIRKITYTVEFKNDYALGFVICETFTVITLQDWVGWGIFTVILGYPRRANGDSQHLEAHPVLQDWLRFELFTVKNYRTGPFSK